MLSTNKLRVSLVYRFRQSLRNKIRSHSSTVPGARPRGSGDQHRRCPSRRSFSSEKDNKAEISLEDVARSLSQLSGQQQPVLELAKKLSPEAQRELVQLTSASASAAGSDATAAVVSNEAAENLAEAAVPPPAYRDLKLVALAQAIPFLGFGFMDNAILIIAGDAIDTSLGTKACYHHLSGGCCVTNRCEMFEFFTGVLLFIEFALYFFKKPSRCCFGDQYAVRSRDR